MKTPASIPLRQTIPVAAVLISLMALIVAGASGGGQKPTGEQVYRKQCASCHGAKGEGAKGYPKPLAGTLSEGQLAVFIAKSMPPGPRKCSTADSRLVAGFIHEAFYSPLAQERKRPARVELSRLTVRQYRNALADLVGSFRAVGHQDDRRGLRGEYFKANQFRPADRVVDRIDPQLRFEFGAAAAVPGQPDPYQFSIRWIGSVIAPDTGEYEFTIKTDHEVRLWVNDLNRRLIDATVKSGKDNEYRASLYLVGGRAYPLRVEFGKGVTGVNNLEVLKKKPALPATVVLEWKPPGALVSSGIPTRCLAPSFFAEGYSVSAPFPPDDRSIGYERGTTISKAWEEATTEGAIETTGYIAAHLAELSGVKDADPDREKSLRVFCRKFAERAFRRPLTAEMEQSFVGSHFDGSKDLDTSVKRSLLLVLKSPRFLYREAGAASRDAYDVASKLSFGLWDTLPDQALLRAAAAGELQTSEQISQQAARMASDPRAWTKLREFFLQWLKVDAHPELPKDAKRFPGFDASVAEDLRTSLELFLERTVWSDKSDYRELLLSDSVFVNGKLAPMYGASLPADSGFQPVAINPGERAGVLTHPYIMSTFAYQSGSSPIHRGVLLARSVMGRTLRPPKEAIVPLSAELRPDLTTRQRVALQTKSEACMSCHDLINPLGFSLEKFDAIGRFQTSENGKPVVATGSYVTTSGKSVKFTGAKDLAEFVAGSQEAHSAFVERLFHHLVKQPVRAYGPKTLADLTRYFQANEFSIRKLMVEIMARTASGV